MDLVDLDANMEIDALDTGLFLLMFKMACNPTFNFSQKYEYVYENRFNFIKYIYLNLWMIYK